MIRVTAAELAQSIKEDSTPAQCLKLMEELQELVVRMAAARMDDEFREFLADVVGILQGKAMPTESKH